MLEKDGASEGVAWCLKDLGTAASELGQLALGFDLLDQAYRIFWELGSPIGKPSILESLGQNALARGAFADARRWLSEASSLFRALDHRLGVARVLDGEGDLLRAEGRPEADDRFREALVIWGEVGNGKRIRDDLLRLGDGMADLPLSVRIWAAAHRMGETMGVPVPLPLRERHERAVEEARAWAGFAEAWAEGWEMSPDAALGLALKG
ncbi:hypothetical protein EON77_00290 [bacterium]|nr:MAG: hypothetical protein EON77_00290 [bacterium]